MFKYLNGLKLLFGFIMESFYKKKVVVQALSRSIKSKNHLSRIKPNQSELQILYINFHLFARFAFLFLSKLILKTLSQ